MIETGSPRFQFLTPKQTGASSIETQFQYIKPIHIGGDISCFRINGRGGRRMLIRAGEYVYTLEELKVLRDKYAGLTSVDIDQKNGVVSARNLKWKLKKRNNGVPLLDLYKNANEMELFHPFVLDGLELLLLHS